MSGGVFGGVSRLGFLETKMHTGTPFPTFRGPLPRVSYREKVSRHTETLSIVWRDSDNDVEMVVATLTFGRVDGQSSTCPDTCLETPLVRL